MTAGDMALVVYFSIGCAAATWAALQGALAVRAGVSTEHTLAGSAANNTGSAITAFFLWPLMAPVLLSDAITFARAGGNEQANTSARAPARADGGNSSTFTILLPPATGTGQPPQPTAAIIDDFTALRERLDALAGITAAEAAQAMQRGIANLPKSHDLALPFPTSKDQR